MQGMTIWALPGVPMVQPGDDLAALIVERLAAAGEELLAGDVLVIAQKVVSKAEGRLVKLADVIVNECAQEVAEITGKDPRVVQVILDDSDEILRAKPGLLIVQQKAGWIAAHGGVDRSNVRPDDDGGDRLALLPVDGDASAQAIRDRLAELTGVAPAIIVSDSHGRPWRVGTVGVCIGCAGLPPIWNQRGLHDLFGYELVGSEECIADELTAAASLVMGQSDEGTPVILIRGYVLPKGVPPAPSKTIQRAKAMDAFR